jgi:hypothetical protein
MGVALKKISYKVLAAVLALALALVGTPIPALEVVSQDLGLAPKKSYALAAVDDGILIAFVAFVAACTGVNIARVPYAAGGDNTNFLANASTAIAKFRESNEAAWQSFVSALSQRAVGGMLSLRAVGVNTISAIQSWVHSLQSDDKTVMSDGVTLNHFSWNSSLDSILSNAGDSNINVYKNWMSKYTPGVDYYYQGLVVIHLSNGSTQLVSAISKTPDWHFTVSYNSYPYTTYYSSIADALSNANFQLQVGWSNETKTLSSLNIIDGHKTSTITCLPSEYSSIEFYSLSQTYNNYTYTPRIYIQAITGPHSSLSKSFTQGEISTSNLSGTPSDLASGISSDTATAGQAIDATGGVANVAPKAIDGYADVVGTITSTGSDVIDGLNSLGDSLTGIGNDVLTGVNSLGDSLTGIGNDVLTGVQSQTKSLTDALTGIGDDVLTGVQSQTKSLTDALTGIGDDVITGVKAIPTSISTAATDITDAISGATTSIIDGVGTWVLGDTSTSPDLLKLTADLTKVFPFSIPFDLINMVSALSAKPVAPSFDFTIFGGDYFPNQTFNIDLSGFDQVASWVRTAELFATAVGLILLTRYLIKG